jgi:Transcription elongation factor, GreA/GreB, C-term
VAEPAEKLKIAIGSLVDVELVSQNGEVERLAFTLVEDKQADFSDGFLGMSTPLARTILGKTAGEVIPYQTGDLKSVKILSVQPSNRVQTENVAARRQAVIRKAVDHSDYINAMIFAGSVNSKWGDYDIGKLDPSQWGEEDSEEVDEEDEH